MDTYTLKDVIFTLLAKIDVSPHFVQCYEGRKKHHSVETHYEMLVISFFPNRH